MTGKTALAGFFSPIPVLAALSVLVAAFAIGGQYLIESRKAELASDWVGECVDTVAGARGNVLDADLDTVRVAFPSGVIERYRYGEVEKVSCE